MASNDEILLFNSGISFFDIVTRSDLAVTSDDSRTKKKKIQMLSISVKKKLGQFVNFWDLIIYRISCKIFRCSLDISLDE